MSARLRAAVLGATGVVGQKIVSRLAGHPWFELVHVAASERSAGRCYGAAVHWLDERPLPQAAAGLPVAEAGEVAPVDVAFSALDAATARRVEPRWAAAGVPVVSNASALRMEPGVPLLVPEVNATHLDGLRRNGPGFVVTNPNCSTVGLVAALKPLADTFGIARVHVTTLQAVSGAGWPGLSALDILGNAIPWIDGEEEKLVRETGKILGDGLLPAAFPVSAQTCRVPVLDGHLLSIAVTLRGSVSEAEARSALAEWGEAARLDLPSSPGAALHVFDDGPFPQPRLHAALGGGMTVSVGRVRRCAAGDLRMVALVHNTERGAAGAALLNAELLASRGLLGGEPREVLTVDRLEAAR